jgi:hypothetical protein
VVLDTGDEAAVDRFFTDEPPWDHVVVSAAQTRTGPVRTLALADAKAAMESKFWGAYRVAGGQGGFRLGPAADSCTAANGPWVRSPNRRQSLT